MHARRRRRVRRRRSSGSRAGPICAARSAATRGRPWRDHYSWQQHVERLWTFAAELSARQRRAEQVETGDAYKDQVQNQWNNNPVGSETRT